MTTIVGIAGSLRKGSYNRALLAGAASAVPAGISIQIASFEGFPVYDGDLEAERGVPEVVERLKGAIATADGLLLVTPEYNNSIPGPLKNAIDWLSRPPKDVARVFAKLPVGLIGATPGRGGTRFAQVAWLPVFRTLGMLPWFEKSLYLADAAQVFGPDGALVDPRIDELLREYVSGFAGFCQSQPRHTA
jgi:NAD(P)H-dependent FMN reductase